MRNNNADFVSIKSLFKENSYTLIRLFVNDPGESASINEIKKLLHLSKKTDNYGTRIDSHYIKNEYKGKPIGLLRCKNIYRGDNICPICFKSKKIISLRVYQMNFYYGMATKPELIILKMNRSINESIRIAVIGYMNKKNKNPFDPKNNALFEFFYNPEEHPSKQILCTKIINTASKIPAEVLDQLDKAGDIEKRFPLKKWSQEIDDFIVNL